ncbi:hypothetical protein Daura_21625 [Dactylosporangium aurantiacum]|uniref:DUF5666 domain-containing protein n=1 Tax=Dactylosporangium aurantiacum TaxID=35754 RepID=A0A9Q9IN46_9ACTN|nr:hypothetical protein [Dactylosporangium aurantiacum]MDG6108262.1 hypothetical protein [Dactylosporangium aurantiacum]UWZ58546.1 hypothetical protein Daura_21625 [Dactylosporangium aurantiacum]
MRPLRTALGLVAVTLLAGCSGQATPAPAGPASPAASAASSVPGTPAGSARTGGTGPHPTAAPTPSLPLDPENPQDLRGAPMTITGTVHTRPGCVILDAGAARWALTGPLATTLRDGATVTVRGRPTAVPAGCGADHALDVQQRG